MSFLAQQFRARADQSEASRLASNLGLSIESLRRLGLGWAEKLRAWSFPMREESGCILGIRLRRPDGSKLCVKGSREGLFIPFDYFRDDPPRGLLFICEGPTDTAAMLDLGFAVAGRPSCEGGIALLRRLVRLSGPGLLAILADRDAPGQRGAERLANSLSVHCADVRVFTPPSGIKDARDWKRAGGRRGDVLAAMAEARQRRLEVVAPSGGARV